MPLPDRTAPILVSTSAELGATVRARREALGLGLREAAPVLHVGVRFLSEFERGKPTAELGKVLAALHGVGLDLAVMPRGNDHKSVDETGEGDWSKRLGMAFPYDWSNNRMDADTFIHQVLRARRFDDVLKLVGHFGLDRVGQAVTRLDDRAARDSAAALLSRIYQGMLLAQGDDTDAAAA